MTALLVAAALLVGCLGQPGEDPSVPHGFSGVFMPTAGAADVLELGDRVRAEGGELTIEERVPPRFTAWGLTLHACEVVREYAVMQLYIDTMGACEPAAITTAEPALVAAAQPVAPNEPVLASAPVAGESW